MDGIIKSNSFRENAMRPRHRAVRGKTNKDHLVDNSLQLERYQPSREYLTLGEIADELAKLDGYRA